MLSQHVTFVLGLWGSVLATVLAVLKILEYRYQMFHNLQVFATVNPPFKMLDIEVINTGKKPITITKVQFGYGRTPGESHLILESKQDLPSKLAEGDQWVLMLDCEALKTGAMNRGIAPTYYHLIWVTIISATKNQFHCRLEIDSSILKTEFYPPASAFIASDVLLGFPQKKSEIFKAPITHK